MLIVWIIQKKPGGLNDMRTSQLVERNVGRFVKKRQVLEGMQGECKT